MPSQIHNLSETNLLSNLIGGSSCNRILHYPRLETRRRGEHLMTGEQSCQRGKTVN